MLLKSIVIALTMTLGVAVVAFYGQGPTTTNPEEAAIGRSTKPITLLNAPQNPSSTHSVENRDTSKADVLITAR